MINQFWKISSLSMVVCAGFLAMSSLPALAEDKCAGQEWPNYTDDCIDQIVAEICKAGGGGSSCDESEARKLAVTGKVRSNTPPRTISRTIRMQSKTKSQRAR